MGHTLARNGDGKRVSKKKERERDEGVGELESQVESSYCRHLHGHRPRVPTEPAHAWWGRGEGKVGRFRDGGRWYCRVEFERTVLRMEIRRRVPSSILLSSPPLSTTSSPLPTLCLASISQPPVPLSAFVLCFSRFHPRTLCFDLRGGPLSYKMVARPHFCSFSGGRRHHVDSFGETRVFRRV